MAYRLTGSWNPITFIFDRRAAIRRASRCRYRQSRARDVDGGVRGWRKGKSKQHQIRSREERLSGTVLILAVSCLRS
jgi:hypothetical protein